MRPEGEKRQVGQEEIGGHHREGLGKATASEQLLNIEEPIACREMVSPQCCPTNCKKGLRSGNFVIFGIVEKPRKTKEDSGLGPPSYRLLPASPIRSET